MGKNADLVLIAAVAKNKVIGNAGDIPWHIPEDMKRFKELTRGHPVLMGRKTYFSIPDKFRPLKGRTNIVLTGNRDISAKILLEGAISCYSIQDAMNISSVYGSETYVAGGQRVYEETINLASKLELTEIDREYSGDAYFPSIDSELWRESIRENILSDVSFVTYVRR